MSLDIHACLDMGMALFFALCIQDIGMDFLCSLIVDTECPASSQPFAGYIWYWRVSACRSEGFLWIAWVWERQVCLLLSLHSQCCRVVIELVSIQEHPCWTFCEHLRSFCNGCGLWSTPYAFFCLKDWHLWPFMTTISCMQQILGLF